MPRQRQRATLEAGLKLDINALLRDRRMPRGLNGAKAGTLLVKYPDGFEQEIAFTSRPRHFGGRQFFFQCPATGRLASVLWKPPGATRFCSRHAWPRQVAYQTAQVDRTSRAHIAKAKVRASLGADDRWLDDLPPRPKHMRATTYARLEARYELQDEKLDAMLLRLFQTKWAPLLKAFK
jgi:hypothetical protein